MSNVLKKIAVVHYGEIAIKGHNRKFFEKQLVRNIKRALTTEACDRVQRLHGRLLIYLAKGAKQEQVAERLSNIFGIANFGFGVVVPKDMNAIREQAWQLLSNLKFESFSVFTRRSQKDFALNSMQINQEVGAFIYERCKKRVDLGAPEATANIEITEAGAIVSAQRTPGLRGLPVGVSERAVSLLSSGIDSPVASYMMLKRGVHLVYAHFHSQPYTNQASQDNTERLVTLLAKFQYYAKVYFIPFINIQKEIMAKAPAEFRVLLYRRYMVRLAERVAKLERCRALVTGENVAQVASQTLSNIRVVGEVTALPILRPLAGFDKDEIVERARRIGTFEISTAPYQDCCSLFIPENPATKAHPERLVSAERLLEVEALMDDVMAQAEIKEFRYGQD